MVDVFDEVEEELRQDEYRELLRKWGPWVGAGAAAIVVAVSGYQFTSWRAQAAAAEASDAFVAAADAYEVGNLGAAQSGFEALAADGPRGYATLSLLRLGEIELESGNNDQAAQYFERAAERAPDQETRELSLYKAALARFDDLSYDDLAVRLQPLVEDSGLSILARELVAAAAMRDGRWDAARAEYELLTNTALNPLPGVAARAVQALAFIEQNAPAPVQSPAQAEDVPGDAGLPTDDASDVVPTQTDPAADADAPASPQDEENGQ